MNNIAWNERRERNKVLLIVEGQHEKEKLLTRMLASFPEINIETNNIWIYETNIYMLISKIVREYGEDWFEQDIDLPYLIGKAKQFPFRETKKNYTNIFLIFDYERHDPNFSEQNILKMQEYFSSAEDVGKLYINYPMVESYMDFYSPPDESLKFKSVSSLIQNGSEYKNLVKNTFVSDLIQHPFKIFDILVENYGVDVSIAKNFVEHLINRKDISTLNDFIEQQLGGFVEDKDIKTFFHQLFHMVSSLKYMENSNTYNSYMRDVFKKIVCHNVRKANRIQNGVYDCEDQFLKEIFANINEYSILNKQNASSDFDGNALISVLNTSVFILPEYNTNLVF